MVDVRRCQVRWYGGLDKVHEAPSEVRLCPGEEVLLSWEVSCSALFGKVHEAPSEVWQFPGEEFMRAWEVSWSALVCSVLDWWSLKRFLKVVGWLPFVYLQ